VVATILGHKAFTTASALTAASYVFSESGNKALRVISLGRPLMHCKCWHTCQSLSARGSSTTCRAPGAAACCCVACYHSRPAYSEPSAGNTSQSHQPATADLCDMAGGWFNYRSGHAQHYISGPVCAVVGRWLRMHCIANRVGASCMQDAAHQLWPTMGPCTLGTLHKKVLHNGHHHFHHHVHHDPTNV